MRSVASWWRSRRLRLTISHLEMALLSLWVELYRDDHIDGIEDTIMKMYAIKRDLVLMLERMRHR